MALALALALLLLGQVAALSATPSRKVCGRPPVSEGVDSAAWRRVYEVGEEVTLTCQQGFTPSTETPRRIACSPAAQWTQSDLTCTPRMCPIPAPLRPLAKGRIEAPFRTVLNFSCDPGYVLLGANESRCLHDGTWSQAPPLCKAVNCPLPTPPAGGRVVHDRPVTAAQTRYGQEWSYECDAPNAPSHERGSCRADGTPTEPPLCREVHCPVPPPLRHGFIVFAVMREHGYQETVRYGCTQHYVLDGAESIRCQNTGNWTAKPACRAPCSVAIKRGRIFYNGRKIWIADLRPNRVLHGEHVAFYCLNKADKCGYPVVSTCEDGNLPIPACFEVPGKVEYTLKAKSLPSEIAMCATAPPGGNTGST